MVGYLRASGYFAIRPFLSNVPHIRILVGINVDAIMADYLDGFLSLPFVSDEEKHLIKAARQAIRRARFLKLQRQINQLQRSTKEVKITPAALADTLIQILRGYPLLDQSDQPVTAVHPRFLDTPPDIILSESFDHSQK
jgi:hypothetical protein